MTTQLSNTPENGSKEEPNSYYRLHAERSGTKKMKQELNYKQIQGNTLVGKWNEARRLAEQGEQVFIKTDAGEMVQMTLSGIGWVCGDAYMKQPTDSNYYYLTAFGKIPYIATREAVELTFAEAAERCEQGRLLEEWSITRQEWSLVASVMSGGRYRAPAIPGPPKRRVVVELDEENDALRPGGKVLVYPAVPANLPSSYSGTVVEL